MKIIEMRGREADPAVERKFDEPRANEIEAPAIDSEVDGDPPLEDEHCGLPEAYRRDG